jgi:ABC-type multidrug transport system fused ATPase/permease subunit
VQILRFAGGLALLFSLEWRLTLLVLAWLPVASASTYFFSRRIHDLTKAHREQRDRSHGAMGESMGAVALIKSCTAEKRALR